VAAFSPADAYWKSTVLMTTARAGVCCSVRVRRVLVEDPELPFPESVAASEIPKPGTTARRRKISVLEHGLRRAGYMLSALGPVCDDRDFGVAVGELGRSSCRLSTSGGQALGVGGISKWSDRRSVRHTLCVGYIIGTGARVDQLLRQRAGLGLMIPR